MESRTPIPPISPHPAGPYTRFAPNQPLNAGPVYDAAPPPPPITPMHHPQMPGQQPLVAAAPSPMPVARPQQPMGARPQPINIPPNSANHFHASAQPSAMIVTRKRLIVACDGTWLNADSGLDKAKVTPPPSNVARISRAIKSVSSDQISQVVYYQPGVGSEGSKFSRVTAGMFGEGLTQNVREGYSFLANNYHQGDEIFLLGFSRGAFTARTIAGLIGAVGLLTKAGLDTLGVVFDDWEHRYNQNYKSSQPNVPFRNKPNAADPGYAQGLQELGMTRLGVKIRAIGVWDTVGSLGIPKVPFLERIGVQNRRIKDYTFADTTIDPIVENAFQALALDEQRSAFSPAVWEKPKKGATILRQVWFPGVHANIGGGYSDQEISNITLAWMMAQLEQFIDFHPNYIQDQHEATLQYYKESGQEARPWSFGEIYNSYKGLFAWAGKTVRTPGEYMRIDPDTGRATRKPLRDTNEYIHPCVRSRSFLDAPGLEDKGMYDSRAMDGYKLKMTGNRPEDNMPLAVWESRAKKRGVPRRVLRESPLWETERKLLSYSRGIEEFVYKPPKMKKQRASSLPPEDGDDRDDSPPPAMTQDRPPRRSEGGGKHHRRNDSVRPDR